MPKEYTNFYQKFRAQLKDRPAMPFDEFVDLALYHPSLGYYTRAKERVGKNQGADFYTSSSTGTLWGQMIVNACQTILKAQDLRKYTLVEIGAEPNCSVFSEIKHPFRRTITYRLGDFIEIPENAIVFSNEWLDAQPFKRFKFNANKSKWYEIGVSIHEGKLIESSLPLKLDHLFPKRSIAGYTIDWPTGSIISIENILSQSWSGLFLTFDYGLSKQVLFNERPEGTARSYFRHQMRNELLKCPGEQDLTCHLCWDELVDCLEEKNFRKPKLQSQESFFMHHSQEKIKSVLENTNDALNLKKQKLKELIHPQHLGNKFQALWAIR